MANKVESIQRENVATPLGDDLVKFLQGQLSAGGLGFPFLQELGTSARQLVSSGGFLPGERESIVREADLSRKRSFQDIREGFGIAGSRLGSGVTNVQARGAEEFGTRLAGELGRVGKAGQALGFQGLQGAGSGLNAILQAIASQGILPPELVEKKGFLGTLGDVLKTGAGIASIFATGGASAPLVAGGAAAGGGGPASFGGQLLGGGNVVPRTDALVPPDFLTPSTFGL